MRGSMPPDTQVLKRALRSELIAARAQLTPEERRDASELIAVRLATLEPFRQAATVGLYAPLGGEVDTATMVRTVLARGGRVAFPRSVAGERRLVFCACHPDELVRGPLGAHEPPPLARELPLTGIECFVIPGVGFSRDGMRMGRGGGYYDATLGGAPGAIRIGVAFDLQLRPSLPREPHDLTLDAIVTERDTLLLTRQVNP
jgi:5-formyltetrahydrofolate cyclo-ligase